MRTVLVLAAVLLVTGPAASETDPPDPTRLGRLALEAGRLEEASEHLETAVAEGLPGVYAAWQLLGRLRLEQGRPEEALHCFDEALARAPRFAPARLGRTRAALWLGRLDDARRDLDAIGRGEEFVRLLQRICDAEASRELWDALSGYHQLLVWLGPVPSFQAGLARVAETMEAHDLARCAARSALASASEDGELWYLLGAAEAGHGDADAALAAYERAGVLGFDPARVQVRRGDLLFDRMRIGEALDAYRRAVELDPAAAEVIPRFALAALTAEQTEVLREVLERHVAAHPDNLDTLYALAVLSLRAGDLAAAERRFLRLASAAPGHAEVHYNLGQLYLRQGRTAEGEAELARFAELEEAAREDWERHNQAHFRRLEAEQATSAGRPQEAVRLYLRNVTEGTASPEDQLALAGAYLAAGDARQAAEQYRGILAASPYLPSALEGLSAALEAAGGAAEAEAVRSRLELLRLEAWRGQLPVLDPEPERTMGPDR